MRSWKNRHAPLVMLANSDMSDEEKREFLDAIWAIVVCAVDLGFGVHPLQQACESRLKVDDICHLNAADVVTSKSRPTIQTFENAARHKIIGREEGKESWVKINEKP